jgi:hypothetical protein
LALAGKAVEAEDDGEEAEQYRHHHGGVDLADHLQEHVEVFRVEPDHGRNPVDAEAAALTGGAGQAAAEDGQGLRWNQHTGRRPLSLVPGRNLVPSFLELAVARFVVGVAAREVDAAHAGGKHREHQGEHRRQAEPGGAQIGEELLADQDADHAANIGPALIGWNDPTVDHAVERDWVEMTMGRFFHPSS